MSQKCLRMSDRVPIMAQFTSHILSIIPRDVPKSQRPKYLNQARKP